MMSFQGKLANLGLSATRESVATLQVNLGKRCNQACHHCHVDASPKRTEMMDEKAVQRVLDLLDKSKTIHTLDITGGAPELNPHFRSLVRAAKNMSKEVIDRCNLTVLLEKSQEDLAQFLAEWGVHVIASLPCYTQENVDRQRGSGVFEKSMTALRLLNGLGYGREDTGLILDFVYNPLGPVLPGDQTSLEKDYKLRLRADFGVEFNHLFALANMPINRFLNDLERAGKTHDYHDLLCKSFNPAAVEGIMCKSLVSVAWNGELFDCDFNQMLGLSLRGKKQTIWEIDSFDDLGKQPIVFGEHCYGCTAGAGSSCTGALI